MSFTNRGSKKNSERDNRGSEDMKKTVNFSLDSKESVHDATFDEDKLVDGIADEAEEEIGRPGQRLQHTETENIFAEDIISKGKAAVRRRSIEKRKYLENHIEGLSDEHDDILSNWINGGNVSSSDMNGNLNGSYINSLNGTFAGEVARDHDSRQRRGSNKRLSKANVKELDKRFNGVSNESMNENDDAVKDGGLLNSADVTQNVNGQEEDIPRSIGQIHKNKNNRKSHSNSLSLKQFGLDHEVDIRYVPSLRCSKSHQQPTNKFRMDGWKKRVVAKKHLVKLTKVDKVTENGSNTDTVNENYIDLKSGNADRDSHESFENSTLDVSVSLCESHVNSTMFAAHNKCDFDERTLHFGEFSKADQSADNSGKGFGEGNDDVDDDDGEMLHLPKKPVYDASNSSTAMILLNKRDEKNSRLWRRNISHHVNRGNLINPARHVHNTTPSTVHTRCRSSSIEKYDPVKSIFLFDERPQSRKIGDRLHEGRMSVNPHRHRACAVNGSQASLDSKGETRKDDRSSYKNSWLRIYSKPHERREPTGLTKTVPNFREKISSPAWSSTNISSIYNRKTTE